MTTMTLADLDDAYAITLDPYWADQVARGLKPIENRAFRLLCTDTLLIHAGMKAMLKRHPDTLVRGAIVAVAQVDSVCEESRWRTEVCCDCGPTAMPRRAHWRLTDVRALARPVKAKGTQGLWTPDPVTLEAVKEQI